MPSLIRLLLAAALFGHGSAAPAAPAPPNIVHIIADDMGYSDLGCYGGEIETPHLSNSSQPDGPNAPHHRGFDHFYGTIEGASDFFAPVDLQLDGKSMTHEWKDNADYYYTDAITDHAQDFLRKTKPEKPFYLYLAYTAAHWPLHARPGDIDHYKGRYAMGWDKLRMQRHARMKNLGVIDTDWDLSPRHPQVPAWTDAELKDWQQRRMEVYAAQITSMDRNIGRIVDHLKKTGTFDNTIILFHHDNGGCHVEYGTERKGSWTREFTTDGNKQPIRPGNIPGLSPPPPYAQIPTSSAAIRGASTLLAAKSQQIDIPAATHSMTQNATSHSVWHPSKMLAPHSLQSNRFPPIHFS